MNNFRNALPAVACSHVHARYPQALPQFSGASEKAQSRAVQGFAGQTESFLLDPHVPMMQIRAFCTMYRSGR
jgi:hypothetical protein